jgi:CYTH domain-containing protein
MGPLEIERKYVLERLPDLDRPPLARSRRLRIEQTYLRSPEGTSERVRLVQEPGEPERYFHTSKRRVSALAREEVEHEIDRAQYERLLDLRDPDRGTIRKTRHVFWYDDRSFELDVFDDPPNLVLLEVELPAEDAEVNLPQFAGLHEVTGNARYSNSEIARAVGRT